MCKAASHVPSPDCSVKRGVCLRCPTQSFMNLAALGDAVIQKYCTRVDPVTSGQNNNPWVQWSTLHNDMLSLDTLLTMSPVCSLKGELGGLTAMQPHLGKARRA